MRANEALALTKQSFKNVTDLRLQDAYSKIEDAAKQGHSDTWLDLSEDSAVAKAVTSTLARDGFQVEQLKTRITICWKGKHKDCKQE